MKYKIYCLTCGELEVVDGEVRHPELEKILISRLEHGFVANYINKL